MRRHGALLIKRRKKMKFYIVCSAHIFIGSLAHPHMHTIAWVCSSTRQTQSFKKPTAPTEERQKMRLNQIKTTTFSDGSGSTTNKNVLRTVQKRLYKCLCMYTYSSHLKLVFYFVCLIHKHFFLHVCTCNVCMARVECTLFFYYVYFVCLSTIIT